MDLSKIDFKNIPVHKNHYIDQNKKFITFSSHRELVTYMFRNLGKGYLVLLFQFNIDHMDYENKRYFRSQVSYLPSSSNDIFRLIGFYHVDDLLIEANQKELFKTVEQFTLDANSHMDRAVCSYHTTSIHNMKIYKVTGIPYFEPLKGMNLHTINMMSILKDLI